MPPSQELQQIATNAGVATPLGQDVGAGAVNVDALNRIVADKNRPVGETIQPLVSGAPSGGYQAPALQGGNEFESGYASYLQGQMNQNTNVSDIRGEMIGMFQDRINALDQVYNDRVRQATVQGQGRVGQGTAVLARRGLAGSPRGGAIQDSILEQNRDINAAINNERNAAIAAIHGEASKMAVEEAQRRREAVERGSKSYLDLLKTQDERRETNVNRIAASLVAQGIDPNTLDPAQLQDIAKQIGVTPQELIGSWAPLAAQAEAEATEKQRKIDMENAKFALDEWKAEIDAQYKANNISLAEARLAHDEALGWYNAATSRQRANTERAAQGQFTLGEGQTRYSADGTPIASNQAGSQSNFGPGNSAFNAYSLAGQILSDPNLNKVVGPIQGGKKAEGFFARIREAASPGTAASIKKIDQFENILALAARGELKGQGPISNLEQELLMDAQTSMSRVSNDSDFRSELSHTRGLIGITNNVPQYAVVTDMSGNIVDEGPMSREQFQSAVEQGYNVRFGTASVQGATTSQSSTPSIIP